MICDVFHLSVVKFSSRDAPLFRPLAASESKDAVKVLVQPACFEDKSRSCPLATCLSESFICRIAVGSSSGHARSKWKPLKAIKQRTSQKGLGKSASAQGDEEAKGG